MPRSKRKTIDQLKAQAIVWNHEHSVGTVVLYHPVIGEKAGRETNTTHEAFVLGEHTAVVHVEREGVVCLDALEALNAS
jgi:hypothetical protein